MRGDVNVMDEGVNAMDAAINSMDEGVCALIIWVSLK